MNRILFKIEIQDAIMTTLEESVRLLIEGLAESNRKFAEANEKFAEANETAVAENA